MSTIRTAASSARGLRLFLLGPLYSCPLCSSLYCLRSEVEAKSAADAVIRLELPKNVSQLVARFSGDVEHPAFHNGLFLTPKPLLIGKVDSQSVQNVEYHYPTLAFSKNNRNSPAGADNGNPNSGGSEDASQDPAVPSQDVDEQGADLSPPDGQEDPNHAPLVNQAQRPPVRAEENSEGIQGIA